MFKIFVSFRTLKFMQNREYSVQPGRAGARGEPRDARAQHAAHTGRDAARTARCGSRCGFHFVPRDGAQRDGLERWGRERRGSAVSGASVATPG